MPSYLSIALTPGGSFTIVKPGEYSVLAVVGLYIEHSALHPTRLVFIGLSGFFGGDSLKIFAEEVRLWRLCQIGRAHV